MNKDFNDVLIVNKKHSSKRSVGLVILSSSGVTYNIQVKHTFVNIFYKMQTGSDVRLL
jgi:hypothetical protein